MRRAASGGPGITDARFEVEDGRIAISRYDGRTATLSKTSEPDRRVALHRRDQAELLAEELRRLDPDDVYAESLAWLFSDARTSDEADADAFTLEAPHAAATAGITEEQRLAAQVEANAPEPGVAAAAATEAMDANEGETGVESEQEIANQ